MAYLHNLIYNSDSTINVVAWSLEVEVQFYVLVPLLAGIFAIADARIRRSVIVILMLASAVLGGQLLHTRLQASVLYYLPLFSGGISLVRPVCDAAGLEGVLGVGCGRALRLAAGVVSQSRSGATSCSRSLSWCFTWLHFGAGSVQNSSAIL